MLLNSRLNLLWIAHQQYFYTQFFLCPECPRNNFGWSMIPAIASIAIRACVDPIGQSCRNLSNSTRWLCF